MYMTENLWVLEDGTSTSFDTTNILVSYEVNGLHLWMIKPSKNYDSLSFKFNGMKGMMLEINTYFVYTNN